MANFKEFEIGLSSYNIVVDVDHEGHDAYGKGRKVHSFGATDNASGGCIIARHWWRCTLKEFARVKNDSPKGFFFGN